MSDYYDVLGVSREASPDEIKKAYRKLARQYHPDVAGAEGAEMFKEVTAAHEVLSNPEKRRVYDMGGGTGGPGGQAGFGFGDIFETFFQAATGGGASRGPASRVRRGQDRLTHLDVDLREVVFGTDREISFDSAVMCGTCHGSCCKPGTGPQTCSECQGRGSVQRVARSFLGNVMTTAPCQVCGGFGSIITDPCTDCSGEGRVRAHRTLTVSIPAGVETGTRIRMSGESEVGAGGGPPGDLYIEIREKQHESFTRRGDDLHCTVEVPMTAAALGTVLALDTLDGEVGVDLAPGTQPEDVLTVRQHGVGKLRSSGRGDLHVHVDVQVPTRMTPDQEDLMRKFAALRGEERPQARVGPIKSSVFQKLRDTFAGR